MNEFGSGRLPKQTLSEKLGSLDTFLDPTLSVLELERRKRKGFNPMNIDLGREGLSKPENLGSEDPGIEYLGIGGVGIEDLDKPEEDRPVKTITGEGIFETGTIQN